MNIVSVCGLSVSQVAEWNKEEWRKFFWEFFNDQMTYVLCVVALTVLSLEVVASLMIKIYASRV